MRVARHTDGPVSIAYDIEGSGPLVVFLHGIGGNRTNWHGQLDRFGDRFCVVSWDARGYGASDDSPQTLTFSDYADDLVCLLDHLQATHAHLVGLSMGGMIIQDFYGRYPGRVATLTLVDTSSGFGSLPEEAKRDFLEQHRLRRGSGDRAVKQMNSHAASGANQARQRQNKVLRFALQGFTPFLSTALCPWARPF